MNKQIIGHEQIAGHLVSAVRAEQVSHAYILEGERGMGKKFLADYFAKLLQCTDRVEDPEAKPWQRLAPCGNCVSCRQAEDGNQPDIIHVTHEKPNLISVKEIREQVVATVDIKPYSSKYKIYIIDDADRMNEEAQNALLKTIEEPPAYAVLLLLAVNRNKLLPTILSRCISLEVRPVENKVIKKFLMSDYGVPDYLAGMAADFSAGNIGRAVRFATAEDFGEMRDCVVRIMRKIDAMSLADVVREVRELTAYKVAVKDCIDLMILWFRDMLVLKATGDANRLLYKDEYSALLDQARKRNYEAIEQALEAMDKAKQRLDANVTFETVLELMLMHMKDFNG